MTSKEQKPDETNCGLGKRDIVLNNHENLAGESINKPRKKLKDILAEKLESAPHIIIDLDFAHVQKDRELTSMVTQLSECIALNKKADKPFKVHFTGLHEELKEKLEKQYDEVKA